MQRVSSKLRSRIAPDPVRSQTFSNYLSSAANGFVIEKDGNEIDSCWDFAGDQGGHCLEGDRLSIPRWRQTPPLSVQRHDTGQTA